MNQSTDPTWTPVDFHCPGLRATLFWTSRGRCLLRVTQIEPGAAVWRAEVLSQPTDDRGLANGFVNTLLTELISFSPLSDRPTAFLWLPYGLSFDIAQSCYYRFSPIDDGRIQ